jgi:hypothetical protein
MGRSINIIICTQIFVTYPLQPNWPQSESTFPTYLDNSPSPRHCLALADRGFHALACDPLYPLMWGLYHALRPVVGGVVSFKKYCRSLKKVVRYTLSQQLDKQSFCVLAA